MSNAIKFNDRGVDCIIDWQYHEYNNKMNGVIVMGLMDRGKRDWDATPIFEFNCQFPSSMMRGTEDQIGAAFDKAFENMSKMVDHMVTDER